MSSPTPVQPPEHTNSQIPTPKPLPKYAWPVILVAIAVASFVIGQRLAPAPEPTVIENESPVTDASGLPLPDGKGGEEEVVEAEPQPVPADIASFEYPKEIPFHADLAVQYGSTLESQGYESVISKKGYDLGPVTVSGQPYRLEMHEVQEAGMGTSYTTYYILTSDQAYDFLLSDRISNDGAYNGITTYHGLADNWKQLTQGPSRIRFKSDVRIPMLEQKDVIAGGMTYYSMGLSHRMSKEELHWLASASDCTHRTSDFSLCMLLPQEKQPPINGEMYPSRINGGFWQLRPDARVEWYVADIPFRTSGDEKPSETFIPAVAWTDGGPKDVSYIQGHVGGCGISAAIDEVPDAQALGELKAAGTYAFSGKKGTVYVADLDIDEDDWMYKSWKEMHAEGSLADFAKTRPFFYWTDTFGRLLKFTSIDAVPPAECGKPVIYLYPEETTDVSVKVAPQGGFTFTDPEYGTGWNVVAQPDGALVNKADGKAYPYLFWEGRGGLYQSPEKYWVVAKADVPAFLTSTLSRLGLNEQEIADFNEFWLPRMEGSPYYKVGFHGTRVMDELAPLDISPKPDSVFRVLMDYEELEAPIPANPPTLPRPFVRDGFTVVEWGGVLR